MEGASSFTTVDMLGEDIKEFTIINTSYY